MSILRYAEIWQARMNQNSTDNAAPAVAIPAASADPKYRIS